MTPPMAIAPLISILPAAFGDVEAEAALIFDSLAEGDVVEEEEVILAGPLADEDAEAEADPLDIDMVMEELDDMVILDILDILELEDMDMLEFDDMDMELAEALAEADAIAARLADPPPIVE